jgi:hypothetical protein
MSVVAKLHVNSILIEQYKGGGSVVKFTAVARGDRNRTWAAATPSGTFEMHCDEEETDLLWGLIRSTRRLQEELRAVVEAETPDGYADRHGPWRWMSEQAGRWQRFPEVLVFSGGATPEKETPWRIERSVKIATISPASDDKTGKVTIENNGGPYLSFAMQIENPPAFAWHWDKFRTTDRGFEMVIVPSFDGYPGDGHTFRESAYPVGYSGHGTCGECGRAEPEHT